jgi:alpha-tubulin suppressor-like RCC1 family protein
VSAGGNYTIAIKTNATLWAWGGNGDGQLGLGYTSDWSNPVKTPTQMGSNSDWSTISAGGSHNIALKNNRTIWTWGNNSAGQLGLGDTYSPRTTPTQVGTDSDWDIIMAANSHTITIKTNSTLWSWGYNYYGQLGLGDTELRTTPTQIMSDSDWSKISVGYYYNIALKKNYTIWTWGLNNSGQLGLGDTINRNVPTLVGE